MITINIPFQLLFLYWHGAMCVLTLVNYIFWVREQWFISETTKNAYLAFCIIGLLVYASVGGPMFVMAFKYSASEKYRRNRSRIGLSSMYVGHVTPTFFIQLVMIINHDVKHALNGITFALMILTWWFATFVVWFIYMGVVAGLLHRKSGLHRDVILQHLVSNARPPPSMTYAITAPNQPEIV